MGELKLQTKNIITAPKSMLDYWAKAGVAEIETRFHAASTFQEDDSPPFFILYNMRLLQCEQCFAIVLSSHRVSYTDDK